ncbi:MAG: hypothetical protein JW787_00835 [Sedimentisphaerales bacterium]|nr:hypothetical protein [Sedimentisphaerales bacterium]
MTTAKKSRMLEIIFLTIIICLISLPAYAKYSGGTGEPNDPYQIATAEDLIALGNEPNDYDRHFILTADIDLAGYVFDKAVIAPDMNDVADQWGRYFLDGTPFSGVFDGNGHIISHLTIRGVGYLGLFGQLGQWYTTDDEVKNLKILDFNIVATGSYIGGLIGQNYGTVTDCYSNGVVSGNNDTGGLVGYNSGDIMMCYSDGIVSGDDDIGGLVGYNNGTLTQCYSNCVVSGNNDTGGLVGYNRGTMTQCYSDSTVGDDRNVGGLVGYNSGDIMMCYSDGTVSGDDDIGGLVGYNNGTLTQCYSTGTVSGTSAVGGLVGGNSIGGSSVTNCFWDTQASGQLNSAGGVGLTTVQMKDKSIFMAYDWDFVGQSDGPSDIWAVPIGGCYPILWWQLSPLPELPIFSGGTGYPYDPYLISTAEKLNSIGYNPRLMESHFKLIADVNLAGMYFYTIGNKAQGYEGVFDGNNHEISNFIYGSNGVDNIGLFGYVFGGSINNLGLIDPKINAGTGNCVGSLVGFIEEGSIISCYSSFSSVIGTGQYIGGLVGYNSYSSTVTHCYSTGAVDGNRFVGGLVGYNINGSVMQCYSTSLVDGTSSVGGLAGGNSGTIIQCYSTGVVDGTSDVGGLVGSNSGGFRSIGNVTHCYSTGIVTGDQYVGGLVGGNGVTIIQCYSTTSVDGNDSIGGLVGFNGGYIYNVIPCFWDMQTSGAIYGVGNTNPDPNGVIGKTTAEMQAKSTFTDVGWDFVSETANGTDDIWRILEGFDYPGFTWVLKASSPYPINGTFDMVKMLTLKWSVGAKVSEHDVYFGDDKTAITNATNETPEIYCGRFPMEITKYDPGILEWGKTYFWRVDEVNETDPNSPWKGDIWTFTITDCVKSPEPADGADDVVRLTILSWLPTEPNLQYDVYFGDDEETIDNATQETPGVYFGRQLSEFTFYNPGILESNKTYYWRIDAIEQDNPMNPWKGKVWSFTTSDFFLLVDVIDDFEIYNDTENPIYGSWEDGWYQDVNNPGNSTGSLVGNWDPPYAEHRIVRSDYQSMPIYYYNDGNSPYTNGSSLYYSEAECTWDITQDWTIDEADTLTLYFRGELYNSPEPLYVGIEDNEGHIAFVVHPNSDAVLAAEWQKWHINLGEVRSAGVNVSAVKKMYIGVGDRDNPKPGGTGKIYIDDIRLTKRMQ